jgi:hypothetical protein
MFTVNWVERGNEGDPRAIEITGLTDADKIVVNCKKKLSQMRFLYIDRPPDGVIVVDNDGNEAKRWFGPAWLKG